MSAFLGKIHYWLFNKILWFENLETDILKLAKEEGLNIENLKMQAEEKYGEKLPNKPLEELIDHNNIHGWLQNKIHSAEGRMAFYTRVILENNDISLGKIENIYKEQGIKAADEVKNKDQDIKNAQDIFTEVNNYILDGMPCDRVNEIIELSDEKVAWKRRICVHKELWEKEHVDVNVFYSLRNLWIEEFVNSLNNNFRYVFDENETFYIERI